MMNAAMKSTRECFDQIMLEMRLLKSDIPSTEIEIFNEKFSSPIMTATLSHLGPFRGGKDHPLVQYAAGAAKAGRLHWIGMCEEEEFNAVMSTGARTVRIVKPYEDEGKIYRQLSLAEKAGAIAVGMDIDHMFDHFGECDVVNGERMSIKSPDMLKAYKNHVSIPFIVKGVLSVKDAAQCAEIGAGGIVVSHHNGRLPAAVPPLIVLPEIIKEVGKVMPVFVDCGICSGMDAYKALAMGATAVGVGAHLMPLLRQGGAAAVEKRLIEMNRELKGAMAYTGVTNVTEFDSSVLHIKNW